jgi:UDP-3-O-[3-hydroxymyristoyl] glucosamine N-acyltransferase
VKLSEVGQIVNGIVFGKKNQKIKEILPPEEADTGDLTFLFDPEQRTRALMVVATSPVRGKSGIVVKNPKRAMYILLKHLASKKFRSGISLRSLIGKDVVLPKRCRIEPFAIIRENVKIGKGTYIGAYCHIGANVIIGQFCTIHPHTVILPGSKIGNYVEIHANTVIGEEGFGFIKNKGYKRIKHIGGVIIDDYVEIGANVTIDRGTIGNTIVGKGTKIDNLVQIAHNVKIGQDCILMGQVGIAGSAKIGNNVTLCGQVGVSDHVKIGDNVVVYAKSAVLKSIPANKQYSGIPAREHRAALRALARLYKE